jgi:long-chain acyl-CoA synthetase
MEEIRSLADVVRVHAAQRGDRTALVAGDRRWSYAALDEESSRAAQALRAAGVGPGDRVAFLDKNAPEYFAFLLGAAKLNAVTVAINWRLAPPEMSYILAHAGAKVLLVGREFLGHLATLELATQPALVVTGGEAGSDPGAPSYADWIAAHPARDPGVPSAWQDTCYQLYTSGTTGRPKGVELSNGNFFGTLHLSSAAWEFDCDSVNLVAMPLFHVAGSGWGLVGLFNGGTNVLLREADPARILRAIPEHRVTNALLVPAVLQALCAAPGVDETDFSSLRNIVYGASPISEAVLLRAMQATRSRFCQVYGATETTGAITVLRPEDHDPGGSKAHLLRSAGQPLPGVGVRIVDPALGTDLAEGEVGEIWIRSTQNLKAYWNDPDATAAVYPEGRDADGMGWLRTGDAGYLRDGYLFIHDRVKDMIVSGGENVYPAEIENALMTHPGVADAAVIGVPHERWGETVKAIVVDAPGDAASDEELIAWCREQLAGYKCPTSVDRVDAIPRNPSGKILKTELRAPYWRGRDRLVN